MAETGCRFLICLLHRYKMFFSIITDFMTFKDSASFSLLLYLMQYWYNTCMLLVPAVCNLLH